MLSELLPEDKRRLHELELKFSELEQGAANANPFDVSLGLSEMASRLDDLTEMANKESKTRRNDMKRRVQHLRASYNHLKFSFETWSRRHEQENFDARKYELIGDLVSSLLKH